MPRMRRPDPGRLRPLIDSFCLALRVAGKADRTRQMYADAVGWFAGWLLGRGFTGDWPAVTRDELRGFFVWMEEAGYSKGYRNNIARCLQAFFKWHAEEEAAPNPFATFTAPAAAKPGEKLVPVIEPEHLAALIRDAERGRDFESRRDAAILRLFACTGVRLAELALLRVADVDVSGREATVTGKGGRQRKVRFDQRCALALDRYSRSRALRRATAADLPGLWLAARRDTAMTPSGVYQVIARRGQRLGIRLHPHMFRHTFTHRWLDAGGAEGDLMELNGWESPQMLRHYGASARAARARRAYDRIDVMGGL